MKNKVILLTTDSWGHGDEELGKTILESFFSLIKQEEGLPAAVFCVNRGVLALTDMSLASLHLKELQHKGVPVLACKTCVDYYGIADKLEAGEISTMKRFIELSAEYEVMTVG
ncbi:DsrE family protein [Paenibacillus caui]|uniref:DsrE family protein n=1 Tax=Paenibacillus caui TaxID=2873927 RepID=UPI001CA96E86|nr:DsrE family protein [Paenibacillus caui]